ncbi:MULTISPECIES: hypothetical protein [unclassified Bradyrhizobium]|uniref:hypothetical protein n=1 Tax=unclassified Bradyrhizobium TaxID=2631580 RepID=UPI0024E1513B|nr:MULTISPECIES: hypothetical protein [unclassified Bradyrhizobium]
MNQSRPNICFGQLRSLYRFYVDPIDALLVDQVQRLGCCPSIGAGVLALLARLDLLLAARLATLVVGDETPRRRSPS